MRFMIVIVRSCVVDASDPEPSVARWADIIEGRVVTVRQRCSALALDRPWPFDRHMDDRQANDPNIHDPAHAPGKRRLGPPPRSPRANLRSSRRRSSSVERLRERPWLPLSGFVGRKRRSARRG
jgi:hypothetical protein